jgi:hypothetical protein
MADIEATGDIVAMEGTEAIADMDMVTTPRTAISVVIAAVSIAPLVTAWDWVTV